MPTITNDSFQADANVFQNVAPANQGDSFQADANVFNNTVTANDSFEADANVVATRLSNTIYDTWISPIMAWQGALAEIYENVQLSGQDTGTFFEIFENVTSEVPVPHIWYLIPVEGHRGDLVAVVGFGFGDSPAAFNGYVTFGPTVPLIQSWQHFSASTPDVNRDIDAFLDIATPEHQRIEFLIPNNAISGDVRVLTDTNATVVIPPPPPPPFYIAQADSGSGAEMMTLGLVGADSGSGAGAESLTAASSPSDAAVGADASTLVVYLTDGDSGSGAETETITAALGDDDPAVGTETETL